MVKFRIVLYAKLSLAYFQYFEKLKGDLRDYLAVCVCVSSSNSSSVVSLLPCVSIVARQRLGRHVLAATIHKLQQKNCWTHCILCDRCRIKGK
jgi:hypothetical protein